MNASPAQLTIDGRAVPVVCPLPPRGAPLSPAQRAILQHIVRQGSIRSVEAGIILLEHSRGSRRLVESRRQYVSSDGGEAMRRLERRGLVRRGVTRGEWIT